MADITSSTSPLSAKRLTHTFTTRFSEKLGAGDLFDLLNSHISTKLSTYDTSKVDPYIIDLHVQLLANDYALQIASKFPDELAKRLATVPATQNYARADISPPSAKTPKESEMPRQQAKPASISSPTPAQRIVQPSPSPAPAPRVDQPLPLSAPASRIDQPSPSPAPAQRIDQRPPSATFTRNSAMDLSKDPFESGANTNGTIPTAIRPTPTLKAVPGEVRPKGRGN
jgi:hypothetical protein